MQEDEITKHPFDGMQAPTVPDTNPKVISEEEVEALLKACAGPSFRQRRDRALLSVMVDTGCRRTEVACMTLERDRSGRANDPRHRQGQQVADRDLLVPDRGGARPLPPVRDKHRARAPVPVARQQRAPQCLTALPRLSVGGRRWPGSCATMGGHFIRTCCAILGRPLDVERAAARLDVGAGRLVGHAHGAPVRACPACRPCDRGRAEACSGKPPESPERGRCRAFRHDEAQSTVTTAPRSRLRAQSTVSELG